MDDYKRKDDKKQAKAGGKQQFSTHAGGVTTKKYML